MSIRDEIAKAIDPAMWELANERKFGWTDANREAMTNQSTRAADALLAAFPWMRDEPSEETVAVRQAEHYVVIAAREFVGTGLAPIGLDVAIEELEEMEAALVAARKVRGE